MHEMSVVSALCDRVLEHLPPDTRLVEATVKVGSLEHLDEAVVQLAWEVYTDDRPPLAGGTLTIEWVAVRVRCGECGAAYEPEHQAFLVCPACERARPEILEGWGITLHTLEAEPIPTVEPPRDGPLAGSKAPSGAVYVDGHEPVSSGGGTKR